MAQTTDIDRHLDKNVRSFYDNLAVDYDRMTGFEKRFVHERPFFHLLVEKFGIQTALDAGCGTGFHSLLLAQLGVKVTAVDISRQMLDRLTLHAKELHLDIDTHQSTFEDLRNAVHQTFDAVFCLGNSLAHLLSAEGLRDALNSFTSVLRPRGILFVQVLNYDRILEQHERVQSVKEAEGLTFVRFYNFETDLVQFNILKLDRTHTPIETSLNSVTLRPILKNELLKELSGTGFTNAKVYGSISMDEFDARSSNDTVVLATRGE